MTIGILIIALGGILMAICLAVGSSYIQKGRTQKAQENRDTIIQNQVDSKKEILDSMKNENSEIQESTNRIESTQNEIKKEMKDMEKKGEKAINQTTENGDNVIKDSNINNGTNNGIIGNNNTVNIGRKPLTFDERDKREIISKVDIFFAENPNVKCISISSMIPTSRSRKFAKMIFTFLKEKGYNVGKGIGKFQSFNDGDTENAIKFGMEKRTNCFGIHVYDV